MPPQFTNSLNAAGISMINASQEIGVYTFYPSKTAESFLFTDKIRDMTKRCEYQNCNVNYLVNNNLTNYKEDKSFYL